MIKVYPGDAGQFPNSDIPCPKGIFLVPGIELRDTQPLSHIPKLLFIYFILILRQELTKLLMALLVQPTARGICKEKVYIWQDPQGLSLGLPTFQSCV